MARIKESIDTVNNLIRTLLATVVIGGLGTASWFGYTKYNETERQAKDLQDTRAALAEKDERLSELSKELDDSAAKLVERDKQIADQGREIQQQADEIVTLETTVADQAKEIDWLDTALRLIKVTHRVARLRVVDQATDSQTGRLKTTVEFVEVDDSGQPLDKPREFTIDGDVVFIDSWIVKFDDKYIEQADHDRSTSLCLFRRIFGEFQEPKDGFELDETGARPTAYARGGVSSDFEKKIWNDFWQIANDPDRAKEMGIRAAHGNAISIKTMPEKAYRITLRASGDLSFEPENNAPPTP